MPALSDLFGRFFMKTLKIGIVGGGGMGKVHFANWAAIEGAEVVALCENSPAGVETAKEWGVPLFASITDINNTVKLKPAKNFRRLLLVSENHQLSCWFQKGFCR